MSRFLRFTALLTLTAVTISSPGIPAMATASSSSVEVTGDPNVHDSFISALCAVLRSWGRDVDYDHVAGLAGIAFSPLYNEGEACRAWWMEGRADQRLDFMAAALGFTVEAIPRDSVPEDQAWNSNPDPARVPALTRRHHAALQTAVESGKVVLVNTWPSWSVLTGWSDEFGQIQFVTMPGFGDLVRRVWGPERTSVAYVLSPAEPTLSEAQVTAAAIEYGAAIARGQIGDDGLRYGGQLYTAAARSLDDTPFCPACGVESAGCASRTLKRMQGTAQAAARFLAYAAVVDGGLKQKLTESAHRYEEIAAMAAPHIDWEAFGQHWDDPAYRRQLKTDLLRMQALHTQAAEALDAPAE